MEVSLQLWSVREDTQKDFETALKMVKAAGYVGVEFAGCGELKAHEMKQILDETGLYSVGSHTQFNVFENSFEEELEYHNEIGSAYIICPGTEMNTMDEILHTADVLNRASLLAAKNNIMVGYHNHVKEFRKIGDKYILDILKENTSDDVVLELDVFWSTFCGADTARYAKSLGSRMKLVHLKQMDKDKNNVDMPDGIIDMPRIVDISEYATHFIVEHEQFDKPMWECLKNDCDYLNKL